MNSRKLLMLTCLSLMAGFLSSCVSPDPYVRAHQRRGTVGGAAMGAVIGNNVSGISKGEGAAIGAVLGRSMGTTRGRANSVYYGRPYYGGSYYGRSYYRRPAYYYPAPRRSYRYYRY